MNSILNLITEPTVFIPLIAALIVSVTIHEFAHAFAAYRLGDDTPYLAGRVTLNPLAHLDPIGSLLFLLVGFGWGKPVIYDPNNLRGRFDELLIALAGPASNIILAILCNLAGKFFPGGAPLILQMLSGINVLLASFNLIPIPPLDGSSIIAYFWPEYRSYFAGKMGIIILLVVIFIPIGNSNILGILMKPISMLVTFLTTLGGVL